MQAVQSPTIPALGRRDRRRWASRACRRWARSSSCARTRSAAGARSSKRRGKGKAADIEKDLRANLLPGVTIVPAMVIAIEKAQAAGIRYNRQ